MSNFIKAAADLNTSVAFKLPCSHSLALRKHAVEKKVRLSDILRDAIALYFIENGITPGD